MTTDREPIYLPEGYVVDPELMARGGGKFVHPPGVSRGWLFFCYAAGFLGGFSVATMLWWTP